MNPQNGIAKTRMTGCHYRGPYRNFGNPTHDVGLEQQAVHDLRLLAYGSARRGMFPVLPAEQCHQHRADQTKYWSEVRHDLQGGSKRCPQRSPWHFEDPRPSSHSNATAIESCTCATGPVLQGKAVTRMRSRVPCVAAVLFFVLVNIILPVPSTATLGREQLLAEAEAQSIQRILAARAVRIPNRTAQVTIQDRSTC